MVNAKREQYSNNVPGPLHSSHFLDCLGEVTDLTEMVVKKHHPLDHINQTSSEIFSWVIWSLSDSSELLCAIQKA